MELREARLTAEKWAEVIALYCERVEIAGSIRRLKAEVKDIEIVAQPKFGPDPKDAFIGTLFGEAYVKVVNLLLDPLDEWERKGFCTRTKKGEKFQQLALTKPEINIDLFMVTPPAQWGVILALRTGPADFSKWLVTPRSKRGALPSYLHVKDGAVWNDEELVPTTEEIDFLDLCGLGWINPSERKGPR